MKLLMNSTPLLRIKAWNRLLVQGSRSNATFLSKFIDTNKEVAEALATQKPIVALESTIITHGMPYPENINTAREVEEIVRAERSVPATIALVNGRIKVGLEAEDWDVLASAQNLLKISRRDLGYAISQGASGGTTVAGTMTVAHKMGIEIFATGGIGGVHRGVEETGDVSADLIELSRTPVTVFSSGVKSILDIPRTLEYLEAMGVLVGVYQGDNGQFPAFYTRTSGEDSVYNFGSIEEIVRLLGANRVLGEKAGTLIGVPIPKESELNKAEIDAAIDTALRSAKEQGIRGKAVTPFLLSAVYAATKGSSLTANKALIKNNARVAAQVAAKLSAVDANWMTTTGTPSAIGTSRRGIPTVIGGAIVDSCFRIVDNDQLQLNGATYQSERRISAGGVGRNIAEAIQRLAGNVNFLSAVGKDPSSQMIRNSLAGAALYLTETADHATCSCSVVFDQSGDCKLIIASDMDIFNTVTPEFVHQHEHVLSASPIVVFDANLNVLAMEALLTLCRHHNIPAFYEPTDMLIAGKPYKGLSKELTAQIKFISPNLAEVLAIGRTLCPVAESHLIAVDGKSSMEEILAAMQKIGPELLKSVDNVLVTLGDRGVILLTNHDPKDSYFSRSGDQFVYAIGEGDAKRPRGLLYAMEDNGGRLEPEGIVNVSGAGDSFTSGFITAMLEGLTGNQCIWKGMAAARCALQSQSAVPKAYKLRGATEIPEEGAKAREFF